METMELLQYLRFREVQKILDELLRHIVVQLSRQKSKLFIMN